MQYTINELKAKIKTLAETNQISTQEVLQNYMFERLLFRISKSKYAKKIILKGGLLVTSISGIRSRTTKDMDVLVQGIQMNKEGLSTVLIEIFSIDGQDGINFELLSSEVIREDDEYGGFRFKLNGLFKNLIVHLSIDLSTGDIITPYAMDYKYPTLFSHDEFIIKSYPIETILAEKIQTILDRNGAKGRMKDYYDVYYFVSFRLVDIDLKLLRLAVQNTFKQRETKSDLDIAETILETISKNQVLNKRWIDYATKHEYSKLLSFIDVLIAVRKIISMIKSTP